MLLSRQERETEPLWKEVGGGGDALVPTQCCPPAYQGCSAEH